MGKLCFEQLRFEKEKSQVRVHFLDLFYFYLSHQALRDIAAFRVDKNCIEFDCSEKRASRRFNQLLNQGFNRLKNRITGHRAVYIHKNSGIPLLGNLSFGLVDRNTNLVEVKPITSCNLDCIFCSVDEGASSKKTVDYVVESDYLVGEFKKLAEYKQCSDLQAIINPHGEPLLYRDIKGLIRGLANIREVNTVSLTTNGVLLTKALVDQLADAGLTQINLSLNALNPKVASTLANTKFGVERILETARYIPHRCLLNLAPIYVPGYNDSEIEPLIEFYQQLKTEFPGRVKLGIQNFLNYRRGRNPVKGMPMDSFYNKLRSLEKKHQARLVLSREDYQVHSTKKLPVPLPKGQSVKARITAPGPYPREKIAAARNRSILVKHCPIEKGELKVKILRTKHNIFSAIPV